MISVTLIEDNRLMREGVVQLLGESDDIRVVDTFAAPDPAKLREAGPDVVLLDYGLEEANSLETVRSIKETMPDARVIVMDLLPCEEDLTEVIRAGVDGFVTKDASLEELEAAIRSVVEGGNVLPPEVTTSLFSEIADAATASRGPEAARDVKMTPREQEVIDCIARGLSNQKIADELTISVHTVKSHVRNIMEKLALHSRLQIAAWAHDERE